MDTNTDAVLNASDVFVLTRYADTEVPVGVFDCVNAAVKFIQTHEKVVASEDMIRACLATPASSWALSTESGHRYGYAVHRAEYRDQSAMEGQGFRKRIEAIRDRVCAREEKELRESFQKDKEALDAIASALDKADGSFIEWRGRWNANIEFELRTAKCSYAPLGQTQLYNPIYDKEERVVTECYKVWINFE